MNPEDYESIIRFAKETAAALKRLSDAHDALQERVSELEQNKQAGETYFTTLRKRLGLTHAQLQRLCYRCTSNETAPKAP